jgi:transposase
MIFTRGLRVCLAAEPADLRRSFEGLALLVKEALKEDERSSQIFVFTNRRRRRLSFSIPIRHGDHRIPVASIVWATTARGSTKGAERCRFG